MNKKIIIWVALAVAVLVGIYLVFSSAQKPAEEAMEQAPAPTTGKPPAPTGSVAPAGGTIQVDIKGFAFVKEAVRIAPGTTIVWKNFDDARHTVVGADFQSKLLSKGQTFSYTFTKEGIYPYFCGVHPNMKGEIVVRAGTF